MSSERDDAPNTRARRSAAGRKQRPALSSLLISIPSQTSFLGLVRDVTRKMAEVAGFDESTGERISLAVDEATTNAIEHAYRGAPDRKVEVRIEDRGPDFSVEVVDSGAMVDPRTVPRVDLDRYVNEGRTGGLGVHLMEKIMDSVTFRRSARKNVCRMVKRKEPKAGAREGGA